MASPPGNVLGSRNQLVSSRYCDCPTSPWGFGSFSLSGRQGSLRNESRTNWKMNVRERSEEKQKLNSNGFNQKPKQKHSWLLFPLYWLHSWVGFFPGAQPAAVPGSHPISSATPEEQELLFPKSSDRSLLTDTMHGFQNMCSQD